MKIRLDFGTLVDKNGEPFPAGTDDIFRYMPEDHRYLLSFLQADIAQIRDMVREGVFQKDHGLIVKARDVLRDLHPFMKLDDSISNAYINCEIMSASWGGGSDLLSQEDFESLGVFTDYQSKDYQEYLIVSGERGYGSVYSLFRLQTDLRLRIFLLLDQSHKDYLKVPFQARCGLYGILSQECSSADSEPVIQIPASTAILSYPSSFRTLGAMLDFDDKLRFDFFQEANNMVFNSDAPIDKIMKIIGSLKESEETEAFEEYQIRYLEELFNLESFFMIRDKVSIGKCEKCGRYFAYPVSADDIARRFCDHSDSQGVSCASFERRKAASAEIEAIYKRAYKTRYARLTAGRMSKEELDKWRASANAIKLQAINGDLSLMEFSNIITAD